MGVTSRQASFRAGVPLSTAALLVAGVFPAAGALLNARTAGMSYWATSLPMIVVFPLAILVAAVSSWVISRRGDPVVARWALATAASLLVYFVGMAAMTWLSCIATRVPSSWGGWLSRAWAVISSRSPCGADVRAGSGLRGLSERVNAAGGTLVVSERPAGGTVLEVALPCGR